MTGTAIADITALRGALEGSVVVAGDDEYELARRVWNGSIDRRPAAIARCASTADVATALRYARSAGLEIAVRAGGHSMSGQSVVDDGLVVDLSAMRAVSVDPVAARARVQGGALLSDLDAATAAHGLVVPAGIIGHTGVGGLALGGGLGWRTRQFGLTCDNLISARVVLADGRTVRTSASELPDLHWALRGGGGNFGVVTEFEFACHRADPVIEFAMLFFDLDHGAEVLRLGQDLAGRLPRELTPMLGALNAPPAPFVPPEHQLRPGYALLLGGFGASHQHAAAIAEIRESLPPLFDFVTRMPFTALQQMFDAGNAWGQHYYEQSLYLGDLDDDLIGVITEQVPAKKSPLSLTLLYRLDGAFCESGEDDTAFAGRRTPGWAHFIIAAAPVPEMLPADRAWSRGFRDALRPLRPADTTYVNGMSEFDDDRVRRSYGPKYDRLAQIKREYDPGNIFHRNINIKPAG